MNKFRYMSMLLLSTLLVGCGNTNSNSEHNQKDNDDCIIKEDVEINFLCMSDKKYNDLLVDIIKDFAKVEPHVKVTLSNPLGTGNYSNLENIVVAGFFKENYPDMVQCYPDNVVKYIQRGYAVDVSDYLTNAKYGLGEEAQDYISAFMNEGKGYPVSGTYSLPFCKSTELMYYNADVLLNLDLSGVDPSINGGQPLTASYLDNLTWEELFGKLCPALMQYNANVEPIMVGGEGSAIFTYDSDENFFITLANQYGYGYTSMNANGKGSIDFNNAGMKDLMKTLKSAKDNKYLHTKYSYGNYVSELFVEKKSLFTISSTASLSYNYNSDDPFTIGVAKLPHAEGKNYSSINQGPSVCILDHKDENRSLAAYLLWKHLTNETNSLDWALQTGYMGIRNSTYTSQKYIDELNNTDTSDLYKLAQSENLRKIGDVSDYTFNTAVFVGSSNARKNAGLILRDCLKSIDIDAEIDGIFQGYQIDAESYLG